MADSYDDPNRHRTVQEEWEERRLNLDASLRTQIALTQPPILIREIAGLILTVLLCDLTLYRSYGFAGPAAFFAIAPLLLCLGTVRLRRENSLWLLTAMLVIVSARLLWCGSYLAIASGFVLLCCFSMSLSGVRPYMTWPVVFASRLVAAGLHSLNYYGHSLSRFSPVIIRAHWFAIAMPVATLVTFGTIFVMANPDLVKSFGEGLAQFVEMIERWTSQFMFSEILFCAGAAWIVAGLLRPDFHASDATESVSVDSGQSVKSPLYEGYRNTLAVVIVLFLVYLTFEFQTLWFKRFPKGFHFSGYAHEGAAWLTIALGLATILLSLMFRGTVLADPRIHRLKMLSWIWSIQNVLLALAVFNRLSIYIGFNGMTQMRVIGIFGVTSVVIGFILVLVKIAQNRDFTWLIRRQLWTVSIATYLYAVLPVDAFVNQFNVNRILAGDPAPCVQISVHRTSDEGLLWLKPLIDCPDPIIKDGVRAILNDKLNELEIQLPGQQVLGWTTTQLASRRLLSELRFSKDTMENDLHSVNRHRSLERFHTYAFQWY